MVPAQNVNLRCNNEPPGPLHNNSSEKRHIYARNATISTIAGSQTIPTTLQIGIARIMINYQYCRDWTGVWTSVISPACADPGEPGSAQMEKEGLE